jgi:hypothetical protein
MYRLDELGDCFLLTFRKGESTSRMLIDCGSFRNSGPSKSRLKTIVADIAAEANGSPMDVVVGTHQHNDHVSGFVHCEAEFKAMGVENVWLPWLDDPQDPMAVDIGRDHNNLQMALHGARDKIHALAGPEAKKRLEKVDDILGFYGASDKLPPALPADAVRRLKSMGRNKPQYLRPGTVLDLPGLDAGDVRAYVLGPPRDYAAILQKDPRPGESYDHALAFQTLSAKQFLSAVDAHYGGGDSDERQYPFQDPLKQRAGRGSAQLKALQASYDRPKDKWRNIDDAWLNQAESLSLFLDTFTNNSSLVLALELVSSGKVLLFAADAQTGNWRSWKDVTWPKPHKKVTLEDLLARTVLYKVGHHGSHNATLVQALEMMTNAGLMCVIPVHKQDANIKKPNGWKMPAKNLLVHLKKKSCNRVLEMDGEYAKDCDPAKAPAAAAWKAIGVKPKVTPLYMELEIKDA